MRVDFFFRVSDLPYSIGKLPLSYFDISRNPIKDPKIIEKFKIGTDHLQSYLELRGDLAASDQKRQRKIEQQTAKREPSPPRKRPEKSKKDGLAKRKNPEIRLSHEGSLFFFLFFFFEKSNLIFWVTITPPSSPNFRKKLANVK